MVTCDGLAFHPLEKITILHVHCNRFMLLKPMISTSLKGHYAQRWACAFYCYSSVFSHWRLPDYGKGNTSCYLSYSYLFGEESVTSLKNFCIQGYLFCIKEYSTSHFSIQIIIPWKWTRNENKENHLWKGRLSSCENKITWQEFFLITLTSTVTYK